MGAWIETDIELNKHVGAKSHPTWVRGLKLLYRVEKNHYQLVAPYVGAWIETHHSVELLQIRTVAPYVGAWIETQNCT